MTTAALQFHGVSKSFTLHHQHGAELRVLQSVDLRIAPGECVVLDGPSGMGKSTLLKLVYANYRASSGQIIVYDQARVIPRVSALDVVAEPLLEDAADDAARDAARDNARQWLQRLRIPERLWQLPPATFSGGEQQRINIARNMIKPRPVLLLDEPTASLDAANTQTVIELIREAVARGAAVMGIFHDAHVGEAVATRRVNVAEFRGVRA
jgi:alpha-D-ribose 1-methylphosphonate 5-triphosphate synthase subunit PhnL